MAKNTISSLVGSEDLASLRRLLADTESQIDRASKEGNDALLSLQMEYEELAEKKRQLLREIEKLEKKRDELKSKTEVAENIYGEYLNEIRTKKGIK